jgi:hypothetical protein
LRWGIINNRDAARNGRSGRKYGKSFGKAAQSAFENPKAVINYNNP